MEKSDNGQTELNFSFGSSTDGDCRKECHKSRHFIPISEPDDSELVDKMPDNAELRAKVPECDELTSTVPERAELATNVPKGAEMTAEVPESVELAAEVPESAELAAEVPESADLATEVPASAELAAEVPESAELAAEVPERAELAAEVPESAELAAEVPKSAKLLDDTELMVKVADELVISPSENMVDYDPFLEKSKSVVLGSSTDHATDHTEKKGENVVFIEDNHEPDEPEWLFIGGSQKHKISGSSLSVETSHFVMKRSSVTKMKETSVDNTENA